MKSERITIGQLHYGRKFCTITTATGKRRIDAKTSAALRRANFNEKQLGELLDNLILDAAARRLASCAQEGKPS